ncbi:MAG: hypothetical protein Q7S64_03245 [bacterium]|nr:hypothetical protein [bacterium]
MYQVFFQVVIGELAHGETVVDRPKSHLPQHPELNNDPELLARALKRVVIPPDKVCLPDEKLCFEIDFEEVVGLTDCVTCQEDDRYVWAVPLQRTQYRRYVLSRQGEPCSKVVIVLIFDAWSTVYVLQTAYIGYSPQKYSRFWYEHALIFPGPDSIRPETLTNTRPEDWNYDPSDYLT